MNPDHFDKDVLFIDGECVLCNGIAKRIIDSERYPELYFSSLQGIFLQQLSSKKALDIPQMDTVLLYAEDRLYYKSDAILRIGEKMGGAHHFFAKIFKIFPRNLRDIAYDFIAKNRYKWWGKTEEMTCLIPNKEESRRLIP